MSWNWDSEIEKKEYDNKGMVTISTDEYRDMISSVYRLQNAGQKEHDDWYKEYNRANDLDRKLKVAEAKLASLNEWLEEDGECKAKYKLWQVEKLADREMIPEDKNE